MSRRAKVAVDAASMPAPATRYLASFATALLAASAVLAYALPF